MHRSAGSRFPHEYALQRKPKVRLLRLRLAVAVHTARTGVRQEATDAERHAAASSPPKLMARGTFQHTARRCTAARGCAAVRRSCLALHGRRCQVGHSESPAATPRATSAARQALRRSSGVLKASGFSGAPTRYAPAMIRGVPRHDPRRRVTLCCAERGKTWVRSGFGVGDRAGKEGAVWPQRHVPVPWDAQQGRTSSSAMRAALVTCCVRRTTGARVVVAR